MKKGKAIQNSLVCATILFCKFTSMSQNKLKVTHILEEKNLKYVFYSFSNAPQMKILFKHLTCIFAFLFPLRRNLVVPQIIIYSPLVIIVIIGP